MKRGALTFETVLMSITGLLGLIALISPEAIFLGALWLIALGVMRVFHSLYLGLLYWENSDVRLMTIVYWIGVVIDLSVLYFAEDDYAPFTVVVFPLILACYLWLITYLHRAEKSPPPQLNFETEQPKP